MRNLYLALKLRRFGVLVSSAVETVGAATTRLGAADDFKHLKWFANDGPGKGRHTVGLVFYLGKEKLTMGDGNFALPLSALL